MQTLAALCIRRPVFTWVLALSMVVLGLSAILQMPVERFPNVDIPYVGITTMAPGLSATQVESEISIRMENAIGTVSGVDRIDSVSQEGMSLVFVRFVLEKPVAVAAQDVRDRVARIVSELPLSARPPQVETYDMNASPILLLTLSSPNGSRSLMELTELADTRVRQELQAIRGVGDVQLVGGTKRTIRIELDPIRLMSNDLTAQEVQAALAREDVEAPGGELANGSSSLSIRLSARATTPAALAEVVVAQRSSAAIHLRDVAEIYDGPAVPESLAWLSGSPAISLSVIKQSGANTVAVAEAARRKVEEIAARMPGGVELRVYRDDSEMIQASLHAVQEHLILGALFAALVVLLFLRSWRSTLIAALAIPSSIIGTFAAAQALGITINMMTLLGLTLAVGIVIDDAIVVLENVVRVLRSHTGTAAEATVQATKEIGLAVLATTLSLVAVFLPVAGMSGFVGRYLAPFSLTMTISILLSMFVAFTLTPMLCARWLKKEDEEGQSKDHESKDHQGKDHQGKHHEEELHPKQLATIEGEKQTYDAWRKGTRIDASKDSFLIRNYTRLLAFAMRRRWIVGIGIFVALASIVPIGSMVPGTFVPQEDDARFELYLRLPEGTLAEQTSIVAERLAAEIRKLPEAKASLVAAGATAGRGSHEAVLYVTLKRRGYVPETIKKVREDVALRSLPENAFFMVSPGGDWAAGPDAATIQFVIRGPNLEKLRTIAETLLEKAKSISGTVDQGINVAGQRPELTVSVDRHRASELGVSHAELGSALMLAARSGIRLGTMRDLQNTVEVSNEVRLRVGGSLQVPEDAIRSLAARANDGRLVALSELVQTERKPGPGLIRRVARQRQITLFMNTTPGTSDQVVLDTLKEELAKLNEPEYSGEVIGNAEEMEKTMSAFLVAIGLSFVFMYLVLAAQFESWLHPVTILSSLPLTIPFGLLSLLIFGQSLNLFSALGFLVLFGVVKKNSILQIDHTIALRKEGFTRADAIIVANRHRLRPILMTTLAFVAGLLPLVISSGAGAATNRSIAFGIIGGQTLSLALTLLATPVIYSWLDDVTGWWPKILSKMRILVKRKS